MQDRSVPWIEYYPFVVYILGLATQAKGAGYVCAQVGRERGHNGRWMGGPGVRDDAEGKDVSWGPLRCWCRWCSEDWTTACRWKGVGGMGDGRPLPTRGGSAYLQLSFGHGKRAQQSRWPAFEGRWDDPNRVFCLAAGAGDILSMKWALEERRLLVHGHPVRRRQAFMPPPGYVVDWADPFCYGWTAIHRAACGGRKEVVRYLLDKGWHLKQRTWDGFVAGDVVGMNSFASQGVGTQPGRIKRVLDDDARELINWIAGWDTKWQTLCRNMQACFVVQTVRRTRNRPRLQVQHVPYGTEEAWQTVCGHILAFCCGEGIFEDLGGRAVEKWEAIRASMARWGPAGEKDRRPPTLGYATALTPGALRMLENTESGSANHTARSSQYSTASSRRPRPRTSLNSARSTARHMDGRGGNVGDGGGGGSPYRIHLPTDKGR